jgi:choline kinase
MFRGLIAAAGLSSRLQDLSDKRNKVLLDLGGESILASNLTHFDQTHISHTIVVVGFDGPAAHPACARCVLIHLSSDPQRIEMDFPCDPTAARKLYARQHHPAKRTG